MWVVTGRVSVREIQAKAIIGVESVVGRLQYGLQLIGLLNSWLGWRRIGLGAQIVPCNSVAHVYPASLRAVENAATAKAPPPLG